MTSEHILGSCSLIVYNGEKNRHHAQMYIQLRGTARLQPLIHNAFLETLNPDLPKSLHPRGGG